MQSRRVFMSKVASGLAGTLAASNVLGANNRIRLGIIGPGARGTEILREALACENVECAGAADVYTKRLEDVKKIAPDAKTYLDYRHLLEDRSVDAVLIASPQHLHAEHFVAALEAGKHVYQEKTMAFSVDHARRMRAAMERAGKRTVQIGHQSCSSGQVADAVNMLNGGHVGKITAIHAHMYRNTPHGKPQWSRPVYPDMTPENIIWKSFLGEAPAHEFDPQRYANWRFFWDYSGGNVYENMCHQLSFWYKVHRKQQALRRAQHLQRRRGIRTGLVLRRLALAPPAAGPDRARRIARLEFDPDTRADWRDGELAFAVSGERQAGRGPARVEVGQHIIDLGLDAAEAFGVVHVRHDAAVLAIEPMTDLRRELDGQPFEARIHQNTPAGTPGAAASLPAERALRRKATCCLYDASVIRCVTRLTR